MMTTPDFGIAVHDAESLKNLTAYPEHFDSIAIHADILANRLLIQKKLREFELTGGLVFGLFDAPLCSLAPESSGRVLSEFKSEFIRLCECAAACNLRTLMVPFDVERALLDEAYHRKLLELMRSLFGALYANDQRLLLPLRMPRPGGAVPARLYAAFLQALMWPGAGLYLELHPHEAAFADPAQLQLLDGLRSAVRAVHVLYEPGIGNRIKAPALRPIAHEVSRYHTVKMIFDPAGGREYMDSELPLLEAVAREWTPIPSQENKTC